MSNDLLHRSPHLRCNLPVLSISFLLYLLSFLATVTSAVPNARFNRWPLLFSRRFPLSTARPGAEPKTARLFPVLFPNLDERRQSFPVPSPSFTPLDFFCAISPLQVLLICILDLTLHFPPVDSLLRRFSSLFVGEE